MSFATSQTTYNFIPSSLASNSGNSVGTSSFEAGTLFSSSTAGYIVSIRFYKGSQSNSGTHVGSLWDTTTKQKLTSTTFTSETSTGWQQSDLTTPYLIQANTNYIVSVFMPNSKFSMVTNYYVNPITNGF